MRGIYTVERNATALESWRSSLEAMSISLSETAVADRIQLPDQLNLSKFHAEPGRFNEEVCGPLPRDARVVASKVRQQAILDLALSDVDPGSISIEAIDASRRIRDGADTHVVEKAGGLRREPHSDPPSVARNDRVGENGGVGGDSDPARKLACGNGGQLEGVSLASLDELDEPLSDDEKAQWFAVIAGRLPGDRIPVGEVLTEGELRELLARVLAETRASA